MKTTTGGVSVEGGGGASGAAAQAAESKGRKTGRKMNILNEKFDFLCTKNF
jgi:hypothetical protein